MGISVLLVDDQRLLLAATRCLLERAGVEVAAAVTGLDAAAVALADHRPDVVLLDLSLPGCSGADAVRRLLEHTGAVVVALTEADDDALAAECLAAGAAAVLVRDCGPEDLLAVLGRAGLQHVA